MDTEVMAKLIIIFAFLPLTLFGQRDKTYYALMGCDTALTYQVDTIFTSCDCFFVNAHYLIKDNKLAWTVLEKYVKIEYPKRTGSKVMWMTGRGIEFTIMFTTLYTKSQGASTREITWRYDCKENKLKIVKESYKEYN